MVYWKKATTKKQINPWLIFGVLGAIASIGLGGSTLLWGSVPSKNHPSQEGVHTSEISVKNSQADPKIQIAQLCADLRKAVHGFKWKVDPCPEGLEWKIGGWSVRGRPLVYAEFGAPTSTNTTVVFSMVHGDEITPLYLGLKLAHWLIENKESLNGFKVVLAPLVNPDSFFKKPKTRVNANGVDVNRNFKTRDWDALALKTWKTKFRSDRRRFPGNRPSSEPETLFQEELIMKVQPNKLLSIHAPLNFTDYDGPSTMALDRFPAEYVRECLRLKKTLKAVSGGYFPGSLGNYAGQELGIPTITLELPKADPRKADHYWKHFSTGIRNMIEFTVPDQTASRFQRKDT